MSCTIVERRVTHLCSVFEIDRATYKAWYIPEVPGRPGLVLHGGEWILTRREPQSYAWQRPRFKRVGYYPSLEACRKRVEEMES